jgi:hypothetical protein
MIIKCVVSLQISSVTFHALRRIQRRIVTQVNVSPSKSTLYSGHTFMALQFSVQIFEK